MVAHFIMQVKELNILVVVTFSHVATSVASCYVYMCVYITTLYIVLFILDLFFVHALSSMYVIMQRDS